MGIWMRLEGLRPMPVPVYCFLGQQKRPAGSTGKAEVL